MKNYTRLLIALGCMVYGSSVMTMENPVESPVNNQPDSTALANLRFTGWSLLSCGAGGALNQKFFEHQGAQKAIIHPYFKRPPFLPVMLPFTACLFYAKGLSDLREKGIANKQDQSTYTAFAFGHGLASAQVSRMSWQNFRNSLLTIQGGQMMRIMGKSQMFAALGCAVLAGKNWYQALRS